MKIIKTDRQIQQVKAGQVESISKLGEEIDRCDLPQQPGGAKFLWLLWPGS